MFAHASKNTIDDYQSGRSYAGAMHANESSEPSLHSPFAAPIIQRKGACSCGGGCPACQAKSSDLKVSQPNAPAEIEADQIADRVMRMPAGERVNMSSSPVSIQRKNLSVSGGSPIGGDIGERINSSRGGGRALDPRTRNFMESRFGADFGGVRIHTGAAASALNSDLNAKAFTIGKDIYFGAGQYNHESQSSRSLLAHELTHTLQQSESSPYVYRQIDDEEGQNEESQPTDLEEETATADLPAGDSPDPMQNRQICCSNDEEVPGGGIPHEFDINSDTMTNEICSPTGCVRVTINSRWARTHAARHFRVRMIVFDNGTRRTRTINRRFDVGRETQTFRVGRCNGFMLGIEVISPGTSPNLIGDVTFRNC